MEKNYVEIQGRFSSDGRFVGGNYVPEVIDKLMNDVYSTLGQAGSLYRLRVTVEVEDLALMSSSESLQAKRSTPLLRSV